MEISITRLRVIRDALLIAIDVTPPGEESDYFQQCLIDIEQCINDRETV